MPRKAIDYSRTVIYKIQHIDDESLMYIGHTTDFTKRKACHKSNTSNESGNLYNLNVYTCIRDHGGWDMFNMIEYKKFPCNDSREAEAEEDKIIRELKPSLNTRNPLRTAEQKKEYDANYRQEHKEEISDYSKQHYEANKEKKKTYASDHAEMIKETKRLYREKNRELLNEKRRQYRLRIKNKEN